MIDLFPWPKVCFQNALPSRPSVIEYNVFIGYDTLVSNSNSIVEIICCISCQGSKRVGCILKILRGMTTLMSSWQTVIQHHPSAQVSLG